MSQVDSAREELVLVLDFGSQYAQLIARRVREHKVFCRLVRHDLTAERIRELAPRGIILSGGPASVYDPGAPRFDPAKAPVELKAGPCAAACLDRGLGPGIAGTSRLPVGFAVTWAVTWGPGSRMFVLKQFHLKLISLNLFLKS